MTNIDLDGLDALLVKAGPSKHSTIEDRLWIFNNQAHVVADGSAAAWVSAIHNAAPALIAELREARATIERVRALAERWRTQPTDYDEDTEQQIADGHVLRAALDGER